MIWKRSLEKTVKDKLLSMIGLSQKAGCAVSGEFSCEAAVRSAEGGVLILASDASKNTAKKFNDKCVYYNVPLIRMSSKTELGRAIGKEERSVVFISGKMAEAVINKAKETNITIINI